MLIETMKSRLSVSLGTESVALDISSGNLDMVFKFLKNGKEMKQSTHDTIMPIDPVKLDC